MESPPYGRPACARTAGRLIAPILALALAATGNVGALTVFTPGTPAKANEVNANFAELSDRIGVVEPYTARVEDLEQLPPRVERLEALQEPATLDVDCVADRDALRDALALAAGPGDRLVVTGECAGPVQVTQRGLTLLSGSPQARIVTGSEGPALDILASGVVIDGLKVRAAGGTGAVGIRVQNGEAVVDGVAVNNAETALMVAIGGTVLLRDSAGVDAVVATDGGALLLGDANGTLTLSIHRGAGATVLPQGGTTVLTGLEVLEDARFSALAKVEIDGRLVVSGDAFAAFDAGLELVYRNGSAPEEPGILVERNASLSLTGGSVDAGVRVSGGSDLAATTVDFIDSTGANPGGLLLIDSASALAMTGGKAGAITTTAGSASVVDGVTLEGATDGIALHAIGGHVRTRGDTAIGQDAVVSDNGSLSMEGTTLSGDIVASRNGSIRIGDGVVVQATRAQNGSCPLSPSAGIRLDMGSMMALDTAATELSGFLKLSRFSALDPGSITRLPDVDAEHETADQLPNVGAIKPCSSG